MPSQNDTPATPALTPPMSPDVARAIRVFESLSAQSVTELATIYAPDAHFSDPFNAVQGVDAITQVFRHMFATLENPRFVVTGSVVQADQCFLLWDFRFRFRTFRKNVDQSIAGTSHLRFDAQGRISHHHDYWDAAHGLYQQMPVLGSLMRWLRRRANS